MKRPSRPLYAPTTSRACPPTARESPWTCGTRRTHLDLGLCPRESEAPDVRSWPRHVSRVDARQSADYLHGKPRRRGGFVSAGGRWDRRGVAAGEGSRPGSDVDRPGRDAGGGFSPTGGPNILILTLGERPRIDPLIQTKGITFNPEI